MKRYMGDFDTIVFYSSPSITTVLEKFTTILHYAKENRYSPLPAYTLAATVSAGYYASTIGYPTIHASTTIRYTTTKGLLTR